MKSLRKSTSNILILWVNLNHLSCKNQAWRSYERNLNHISVVFKVYTFPKNTKGKVPSGHFQRFHLTLTFQGHHGATTLDEICISDQGRKMWANLFQKLGVSGRTLGETQLKTSNVKGQNWISIKKIRNDFGFGSRRPFCFACFAFFCLLAVCADVSWYDIAHLHRRKNLPLGHRLPNYLTLRAKKIFLQPW